MLLPAFCFGVFSLKRSPTPKTIRTFSIVTLNQCSFQPFLYLDLVLEVQQSSLCQSFVLLLLDFCCCLCLFLFLLVVEFFVCFVVGVVDCFVFKKMRFKYGIICTEKLDSRYTDSSFLTPQRVGVFCFVFLNFSYSLPMPVINF